MKPFRLASLVCSAAGLIACASPAPLSGTDGLITGRSPYGAASNATHETGKTGQSSATATITQDEGGRLIAYVYQASRWRDSDTLVRFEGRCASACTLYLSLSPEQLCITDTAQFLFHKPQAGNAAAQRSAEYYLLSRYPDWVRNWIAAKGGLKNAYIRMDADYAGRFLRHCDAERAAI